MVGGFVQGFSSLFQGFSLIFQKGIRGFVLIPLLINIVIFSGAVWLAYTQYQQLMGRLLSLLPTWMSWIEWLLLPFFALLIMLVIYYTFSIIANFIAAPFNALLAEKVELKLRGGTVTGSSNISLLKNVGKTLGSEVSKVLYMLKWMPILLLITIIPGLNLIAPLAWLIYGAWMYSLQYIDYPMGNHNLFMKDELVILRKNRGNALGFGLATTLITIIPVLNFLAMPVAVSGATALWVKKLSN
jgi:CysZ protein